MKMFDVLRKNLPEESKRELEMAKFKILYETEVRDNYLLAKTEEKMNEKKKIKTAKFIDKNMRKKGFRPLVKDTLFNCMSDNKIRSELLKFELENNKVKKKDMRLDVFEEEALKILKKYQWKAGGFYIDDSTWKIHKTGETDRTDVEDNEIMLENTINDHDIDTDETQEFLDNIEKRLNSIAGNITVEIREAHKKKDYMTYIWIWCKDENLYSSDSDAEIDL